MLSIFKKKHNLLNITGRLYSSLLGKLLANSEKKVIAGSKSDFSPVFIVGAPRTGSTVLYQLLTNKLRVAYIDNFAHIFNHTIYYALKWSRLWFKEKPHNNFTSKRGGTLSGGLHAPSECGIFWKRFFTPSGRELKQDENVENLELYLKNSFASITELYNAPFVTKNLFNSVRIQLLKEIFPSAKFIVVKRNPVETVKSILKARKNLKTPINEMWSVAPLNYKHIISNAENEVDLVVQQVYFLEKEIYNELTDGGFITVNYDNVINDVSKEINRISDFIAFNEERKDYKMPTLKKRSNANASNDEILRYLSRYDWEQYST